MTKANNTVTPQLRRSQEERRQKTRRNLIDTTISVINEKGYAAMRTGDITKKAQVTWGAAQHLFGSKAELMIQVASQVSDSLIRYLETDIQVDLPADEKLVQVIDQTWSLYSSENYFAMTEIVRGTRKDPQIHDYIVDAQIKVTEKIEKLWVRLFSSNSIPNADVLRLCHLVTLYLSGLASRKMYSMPGANTKQHIDEIKKFTLDQINKTQA
ncbi:MAG: TetR/AcrR family transcriptional regulator [Paraglaciecola sp.]|uniref:TetR/AcrR family transcriptional regulator n=1 Tax=Paraglaciecola sp. TaxID=1920173 RepID=UPI0032660E5E